MREFYPLLILGAVLGVLSTIFITAFFSIKDRKAAIGFDRNMKDSEIARRLFQYARPHWRSFVLVLLVMSFSIAYDIIAPLIVGTLEEAIKDEFEMSYLLSMVALYAGILVVSLICTFFIYYVKCKNCDKNDNSQH